MSAKIFLYNLNGYIVLYVITKLRESSFSQSNVKIDPPSHTKARFKKPTQSRINLLDSHTVIN